MKIGRVRRRKKYRRLHNQKRPYLTTLYLWWVFGSSLQDFSTIPVKTQSQSIFRCSFIVMVSAGFIETDELINELDRPGEFHLQFLLINDFVICTLRYILLLDNLKPLLLGLKMLMRVAGWQRQICWKQRTLKPLT